MKSRDTAEVFYGTDGQVYFRIKAAGNNEVISESEGYRHKADALDVLEAHFASATIVDLTVDE
jgi:uncharacterized protein YegP (UPF0339 family)